MDILIAVVKEEMAILMSARPLTAADPPLRAGSIVFMRDYYAPALLSKKGKAIVSVASVAIFAFSIWAMLQIKIDFDLESFVPDDSHLRDTFDIREEYWGRAEIPTAFYTFGADYKSVAAQTELGELTASVNSATFLVDKSCDSWWTPFVAFAAAQVLCTVPIATTHCKRFIFIF